MFRSLKSIATALFARPATHRPRRRPHPLGLEAMEARDCPAMFTWLGGPGAVDTDCGVAAYWSESLSAPYAPATRVPVESDDVYFRGTASNKNCTSFGSRGGFPPFVTGYKSVSIAAGYTGTVSLIAQPLDIKTLLIDAPQATLAPYSDFTVSQYLEYDAGTIGPGNNPNGTTMHLKGGTATVPSKITPAGGATLNCGVRVSAEASANLVVATGPGYSYGTLNFTTGRTLVATGSSTVVLQGVKLTSSVANPNPVTVKVAQAGDDPWLRADDLDAALGLYVDGGTAHIGGASTSKFTGKTGGVDDFSVEMRQGALVINNGATLETAAASMVQVWGGKLATRATAEGAQSPATIKTKQLVVTQLLQDILTEITISDTAYNAPGVNGHQFGRLAVDGDVYWSGGTYRPVVDGSVNGNVPSVQADLWDAGKVFRIESTPTPGWQGAKIAPGVVNLPAGAPAPAAGRGWRVMAGTSGIGYTNLVPPRTVGNNWYWSRSADTKEAFVYWF